MDLIEQYRMMHEAGKFPGFSCLPHLNEIGLAIMRSRSKTLLDYGSGDGQQYSLAKLDKRWGVEVTCYDPAVKKFETKPFRKFDFVLCCDVLEHIPEEGIGPVLGDVFWHAGKYVFLTISTREARKTLPDGRNCHLTVKPIEWWLQQIGPRQVPYDVVFDEKNSMSSRAS
ncbi:MAG: methyltransferase domain-containing protein [Myxococcales bacterium]|nr:MAG: methyltransferase domain-containing protein [Myxococcales bacterium]